MWESSLGLTIFNFEIPEYGPILPDIFLKRRILYPKVTDKYSTKCWNLTHCARPCVRKWLSETYLLYESFDFGPIARGHACGNYSPRYICSTSDMNPFCQIDFSNEEFLYLKVTDLWCSKPIRNLMCVEINGSPRHICSTSHLILDPLREDMRVEITLRDISALRVIWTHSAR
jgi:hypothetical protein